MIKYKFAYNSQEKIIDIQTLSKSSKQGNYICLGCGHEMVPVLGEKKVKHFRHKVIKEINCSPETYLHKLAKTKFYQTYQDCLENDKPFKIRLLTYPICNFYENDFLTTCQLSVKLKEFELTKFFKKIYLECKEGSFIPDVLLESDKQEKIFFEVAVTHFSSEAKVQSNYRIIEFSINSEDDIKKIESAILEESDEIKFLNFKNKPKGNWCNGKCSNGIVPNASERLIYNIFVVYQNGRSAFIKLPLDYLETLLPQILHFEYISLEQQEDVGSFYRNKVIETHSKKINIRNCFLCRYHAQNESWSKEGTIFCKFLKNTGNSNMASDCKYFRADPQSFYKYQYVEYEDIQEDKKEDEYEWF
jgi:hypothetical protein